MNSERSENEVERGPNGFPYIDTDLCKISQWESGEFHIKLWREDGEMVAANMTPEQFEALRKSVEDVAERSEVPADE